MDLQKSFIFFYFFSRRNSCPPERVRRLEGDDQDKLYESLNPMTDEMLSDSDEIIDEGKLIFHSV